MVDTAQKNGLQIIYENTLVDDSPKYAFLWLIQPKRMV